MDYLEYKSYLAHYGVQGQKWGIRRYQNEDGTLTEAGRRRYGRNLDIKDTSYLNIAKIRTGEAKRRYEQAKMNSASKSELSTYQRALNAAKKNERKMKKIQRGSDLVDKGRTITGNNIKSYLGVVAATGAAYAGSAYVTKALNYSLAKLYASGKYRQSHRNTAQFLNNAATIGLFALPYIPSIHYARQNADIRGYQSARNQGHLTQKRVGGEEYQAVKKELRGKE